MELQQLYKELEHVNSLPLSQSVKKLLSENDDNPLYLEQFIVEHIHKYIMQRTQNTGDLFLIRRLNE